MLFNNDDKKSNDRIIFKTKPNLLLGCKKAIFGVILLIVILSVSPIIIKFIGEMQVYLISQVKLPLTRYAAIAFFVIILINVVYIIWQLIGWYSMEYILTDSKITVKSGVLSTKKNYMPYTTIQDINTSQSIFARMFNVGTVSVFSAYDNNQMELKNISNPSEVEEIIFSRMVGPRNFQAPPQNIPYHQESRLPDEEYYDEYEPITPITHESNMAPRREYEYYPEDFNDFAAKPKHTYEYEPYDGGYNRSPDRINQDIRYNQREVADYHVEDEYYQNNEPQSYYEEEVVQDSQNDPEHMGNSSEKVIRRHFDKFKR